MDAPKVGGRQQVRDTPFLGGVQHVVDAPIVVGIVCTAPIQSRSWSSVRGRRLDFARHPPGV